MNETWDVIIVGGGPAGSTCAADLARQGVKTLLIEKEKHPRYKACGGGVTAKTLPYLSRDIQPVVQRRVTRATLSFQMAEATTRFSESVLAYTVNREDLDLYLLEQAVQAGSRLHEGETVLDMGKSADKMRIATNTDTYHAGVVVGADGANSLIARRTGLPNQVRCGISIESEVAVNDSALKEWQDRVLLDLGSVKGGYAWIFPKRDHLSIGVGGMGVNGKRLNAYFRDFSQFAENQIPGYKVMRKAGHKLPTRLKNSPITGDGYLLAGDAAGLVEPLSGEGIYYAIRSGKIAAEAIAAYLQNPHTASLAEYQRRIDATLMPEIQRAKAFLRIFNWAPHYFYRKLCTSGRLWQATCDLLSGNTSFAGIGNTLGNLAFLLNFLAW